jgi:hypothetical protein
MRSIPTVARWAVLLGALTTAAPELPAAKAKEVEVIVKVVKQKRHHRRHHKKHHRHHACHAAVQGLMTRHNPAGMMGVANLVVARRNKVQARAIMHQLIATRTNIHRSTTISAANKAAMIHQIDMALANLRRVA